MNTEVRDTPRTEAGRRLLDRVVDAPGYGDQPWIDRILAIEAEAAASPAPDRGLREAAERVNHLFSPMFTGGSWIARPDRIEALNALEDALEAEGSREGR